MITSRFAISFSLRCGVIPLKTPSGTRARPSPTLKLKTRYLAWLIYFSGEGFQHGDGVGVLSPNRPEVFYVQTAPLFAGGRYTALHPMGSFDDHKYACDEAELRFLFVDPVYAERGAALKEACDGVEEVVSFGAADGVIDLDSNFLLQSPLSCSSVLDLPVISRLLYTGGTTGVPKAAMLPERSVAQMVFSTSMGWDLPLDRRYLAVAPISHAAGMLVVPTLITGGSVLCFGVLLLPIGLLRLSATELLCHFLSRR